MTAQPAPLAVAEPWNLVAEGYLNDGLWVMEQFSVRAIELADVPTHGIVIDIASGPGTLSIPLASKVKKVHAVDFSEEMLNLLRKRARQHNLNNIEITHGDGQSLTCGDNIYDAGFSMFGLMFFPDRAKGFAELHRVVKPGGKAVVSSWAPVNESPLMTLLFGALNAADPSVKPPPYLPDSLENPEKLKTEMSSAGFENVRVEKHQVRLPPVTAESLWESMHKSAAPLVLRRKRLGESEWEIQSDRCIKYLQEQFQDKTRALSTSAHLCMGTKPS